MNQPADNALRLLNEAVAAARRWRHMMHTALSAHDFDRSCRLSRLLVCAERRIARREQAFRASPVPF